VELGDKRKNIRCLTQTHTHTKHDEQRLALQYSILYAENRRSFQQVADKQSEVRGLQIFKESGEYDDNECDKRVKTKNKCRERKVSTSLCLCVL